MSVWTASAKCAAKKRVVSSFDQFSVEDVQNVLLYRCIGHPIDKSALQYKFTQLSGSHRYGIFIALWWFNRLSYAVMQPTST